MYTASSSNCSRRVWEIMDRVKLLRLMNLILRKTTSNVRNCTRIDQQRVDTANKDHSPNGRVSSVFVLVANESARANSLGRGRMVDVRARVGAWNELRLSWALVMDLAEAEPAEPVVTEVMSA
jgi:hypothetical protein